MSETVRVVVDAMGGDNAPGEIVKGAVQAVQAEKDIKVFLVGRQDAVNAELAKYTYDKEKIEVVHAEEVIEMAEPPVNAIRKKKQSSLVIGMNMIKHQEADAIVTAGSTGATLVGGQVLVGRIKGIERPPLAPLVPTEKGVSLLIDCGANVDARPSHLVQFAQIGSIYMENIVGIKNPRVAILNIGAPPYWEATKDFNVCFNAGLIKSAPILDRRDDISPSFTLESNVAATPSYSFSTMFPANASQTITSAPPCGISRASILPIKLIPGHSFSYGNVSFTS